MEVVNISEGGVFLRAEVPLPIGTELKFGLEIKGIAKKLDMTGVVIRHGQAENIEGFAVEFIRQNPAHKRLIQEFLNERMGEE
jgi:Tfp pilus assembly protein PilZ